MYLLFPTNIKVAFYGFTIKKYLLCINFVTLLHISVWFLLLQNLIIVNFIYNNTVKTLNVSLGMGVKLQQQEIKYQVN